MTSSVDETRQRSRSGRREKDKERKHRNDGDNDRRRKDSRRDDRNRDKKRSHSSRNDGAGDRDGEDRRDRKKMRHRSHGHGSRKNEKRGIDRSRSRSRSRSVDRGQRRSRDASKDKDHSRSESHKKSSTDRHRHSGRDTSSRKRGEKESKVSRSARERNESSSKKKDKKSSSSRSDRKSEKTDRGRENGHKEKSKSRKRSNKGGADEEIKLPKPKPPSNLVPLGPITNIKIALKTKIDEEKDYFAFHNHLRLYLYRSSGRCFEDLSSDETHEAFQRFCDKYNQGELEKSFYDAELPEEAMEQCKRTKHAWKFKTSVAEEKSLNVIKSGVKLQTQYDVKPPTAPARDGINRCMPAVQGNARVFPSSTSRRQVVAPRNDAAMTTSVPIAPARTKPVVPKVDSEKVAMLKRLGLSGLVKPGQKITIAPRK